MGREITQRPNGDWWVHETTTNAGMRVSTVFDTKAALLAALRDGGLLADALKSLDEHSYVGSFMTVGGFSFNMSAAIDDALQKTGNLQKTGHKDCVRPDHFSENERQPGMPADLDPEKLLHAMLNGMGTPGIQVSNPAMRTRMERNGTYQPHAKGSTVELHSLKAAEHNGKRGVVLGPGKDGRLPLNVTLEDGSEKKMSIKYENLAQTTTRASASMTREEIDADIESRRAFATR